MIGLIKEDSAFGPGMMFGIGGPGPSKDTKGIPSDPKKKKGKEPKDMKKHIPTFENFVNEQKVYESYVNMARITAKFLLEDPRIRAAAITLANEIVGKGIEKAMEHADKKLGSNLDSPPKRDYVDYNSDIIKDEEDAKEFISSYMASSVVKPEETTNIPKKKFTEIVKDLKDFFKDKLDFS
jgi:hypothetical protein